MWSMKEKSRYWYQKLGQIETLVWHHFCIIKLAEIPETHVMLVSMLETGTTVCNINRLIFLENSLVCTRSKLGTKALCNNLSDGNKEMQ